MSSSKKLTCKGILQQVYQSLETEETVSHVGISTLLCELLPL